MLLHFLIILCLNFVCFSSTSNIQHLKEKSQKWHFLEEQDVVNDNEPKPQLKLPSKGLNDLNKTPPEGQHMVVYAWISQIDGKYELDYLSKYVHDNSDDSFKRKEKSEVVADILYTDTLTRDGVAHVSIREGDQKGVPEDQKAYWSGSLEGITTQKHIFNFRKLQIASLSKNIATEEKREDLVIKLKSKLMEEFKTALQITGLDSEKMNENETKYLENLRKSILRFLGILDGCNLASQNGEELKVEDLLLINNDGGIAELQDATTPKTHTIEKEKNDVQKITTNDDRVEFVQDLTADSMCPSSVTKQPSFLQLHKRQFDANKAFSKLLQKYGRCSALVKLEKHDEKWDILAAHTTFEYYNKNYRIHKHLESREGAMAFSSYPGCVSSTDDFYLVNNHHGFHGVVMETTIVVMDKQIYQTVGAQSAPEFFHLMSCLKSANSGRHFIELYKKDSGLYTSQWTITDYNLLDERNKKKSNQLLPYTIIVYENPYQAEEAMDVSKLVDDCGWFGSLNIADLKKSRDAVGYSALNEEREPDFFRKTSSRALIFEKHQNKIKNVEDMGCVMQRNHEDDSSEWKEWDQIGELLQDMGANISPRFDQTQKLNREDNGGIDSKVTSRELFEKLEFQGVTGPSRLCTEPFVFDEVPIEGMPKTWDKEFILFSPEGTKVLRGLYDKCNKKCAYKPKQKLE